MLSRATAGIRSKTLIVNLLVAQGAVENLAVLLPVLPHAIQLLRDDPSAEAGIERFDWGIIFTDVPKKYFCSLMDFWHADSTPDAVSEEENQVRGAILTHLKQSCFRWFVSGNQYRIRAHSAESISMQPTLFPGD
jgi:hypothetical protein